LENLLTQAFRTPEGCIAFIYAFAEPLRKDRKSRDQASVASALLELKTIIFPAIAEIKQDDFCDLRLHGYVLCLLGAVESCIEVGLFDLAIEKLEDAAEQLATYGIDDVEMTSLGGPVMSKDVMKSIASISAS